MEPRANEASVLKGLAKDGSNEALDSAFKSGSATVPRTFSLISAAAVTGLLGGESDKEERKKEHSALEEASASSPFPPLFSELSAIRSSPSHFPSRTTLFDALGEKKRREQRKKGVRRKVRLMEIKGGVDNEVRGEEEGGEKGRAKSQASTSSSSSTHPPLFFRPLSLFPRNQSTNKQREKQGGRNSSIPSVRSFSTAFLVDDDPSFSPSSSFHSSSLSDDRPPTLPHDDAELFWFELVSLVGVGHSSSSLSSSSLKSVLRAALAGGMASALSTSLTHPMDTIKTRIQASSAPLSHVLQGIGLIRDAAAKAGGGGGGGVQQLAKSAMVSSLGAPPPARAPPSLSSLLLSRLSVPPTLAFSPPPALSRFLSLLRSVEPKGVRALYRGCVPAIAGQFTGHALRTGVFEATRVLGRGLLGAGVAEYQLSSFASFLGTVLGTLARVPCEVLKQRLQVGLYPNVREALRGILSTPSSSSSPFPASILFSGATATLLREVPFYVCGLMLYQEAKKLLRFLLRRDLSPLEMMVVGALSGGCTAALFTPFDVIKTRTMTGAYRASSNVISTAASLSTSSSSNVLAVGVSIVRSEGLSALYRGALTRFVWVAPLGAMNFSGYELAKQAMEKGDGANVGFELE